jgi:hypothetical protein
MSAGVRKKIAELLDIFMEAKDADTWKLTLEMIAELLGVDRQAVKYVLFQLRKHLRTSKSQYIIAHDPGEGYWLADTRTPEGSKAATRESLKSGRRVFGHAESSGYYHQRIDPKLVVDSKTAKLYAITSMYDEGRKILEGIRAASLNLLAADSAAQAEMRSRRARGAIYCRERARRVEPQRFVRPMPMVRFVVTRDVRLPTVRFRRKRS